MFALWNGIVPLRYAQRRPAKRYTIATQVNVMHARYDDIISRISSPPIWFDEHAVPRYCAFEPGRSSSIHIGEIALTEIACQRCQRRFRVAISAVNFRDQMILQAIRSNTTPGNFHDRTIAEAIRSKTLQYGDPPRHDSDGCDVGASMQSDARRLLEYWRRHDPRYVEFGRVTNIHAWTKWVRDPSLEIDIEPECELR
jgi:hypothetical protein